ncbi:MAG: cell division protein SepF [Candidatus Hadarchaeota archaeon]|nr:cell division protein SepF [Candidatus Hadarchaeota archaeon]
MQSLKRIFTKRAPPKERPIEAAEEVPTLEVTETPRGRGFGEVEPIQVKSMDLQTIVDVQEVANELQAGNIVILDITPIMDEDPAELKRAVDQLKGITQGIGGDVGRLSESRIIATPKFVRIQFKKPA